MLKKNVLMDVLKTKYIKINGKEYFFTAIPDGENYCLISLINKEPNQTNVGKRINLSKVYKAEDITDLIIQTKKELIDMVAKI